jgi:hypothetical protein
MFNGADLRRYNFKFAPQNILLAGVKRLAAIRADTLVFGHFMDYLLCRNIFVQFFALAFGFFPLMCGDDYFFQFGFRHGCIGKCLGFVKKTELLRQHVFLVC